VYVPAEAYVCDGFDCVEAALPSPKFQLYVVAPVLVFEKFTVSGLQPEPVDALKAALAD